MLNRKPSHFSGGQRQQVAMGRAIVRDPRAFLMDEPLSNLDAKLRVQMRAEISRIQREPAATTIYVTHDQVEAMTMGDCVAVVRKGSPAGRRSATAVRRSGGPLRRALHRQSRDDLVEARLERSDRDLVCWVGEQALVLPSEVVAARTALEAYMGRRMALGIRRERLQDAALATDAPSSGGSGGGFF